MIYLKTNFIFITVTFREKKQ